MSSNEEFSSPSFLAFEWLDRLLLVSKLILSLILSMFCCTNDLPDVTSCWCLRESVDMLSRVVVVSVPKGRACVPEVRRGVNGVGSLLRRALADSGDLMSTFLLLVLVLTSLPLLNVPLASAMSKISSKLVSFRSKRSLLLLLFLVRLARELCFLKKSFDVGYFTSSSLSSSTLSCCSSIRIRNEI